MSDRAAVQAGRRERFSRHARTPQAAGWNTHPQITGEERDRPGLGGLGVLSRLASIVSTSIVRSFCPLRQVSHVMEVQKCNDMLDEGVRLFSFVPF